MTAAPAAFSATLPVALALADGEYRVLVLRRNAYGVLSGNRTSTLVEIDVGEAVTLPPLPVDSLALTATGFSVTITGFVLEAIAGGETDLFDRETVEEVQLIISDGVASPTVVDLAINLADGVGRFGYVFNANSGSTLVTVQAAAKGATKTSGAISDTIVVPAETLALSRGYIIQPE